LSNVLATGKFPCHISTTDPCDKCHITGTWRPARLVDHAETIGNCADCHIDTLATGQHTTHILTTPIFDAYHITTSWVATGVDDNEVCGHCESCHAPAPLNHQSVGINNECLRCYSKTTWFNPTQPLPLTPLP